MIRLIFTGSESDWFSAGETESQSSTQSSCVCAFGNAFWEASIRVDYCYRSNGNGSDWVDDFVSEVQGPEVSSVHATPDLIASTAALEPARFGRTEGVAESSGGSVAYISIIEACAEIPSMSFFARVQRFFLARVWPMVARIAQENHEHA